MLFSWTALRLRHGARNTMDHFATPLVAIYYAGIFPLSNLAPFPSCQSSNNNKTCLPAPTNPVKSEDMFLVVMDVLESIVRIPEVVVMLEVSTTTVS